MRKLLICSPVLLLLGCVPDSEHQALKMRLRAEAARNRKAVEQVTRLDSQNIRLRAELLKAGIKLEELGLKYQAVLEKMQWKPGPGVRIGPEGQLIVGGDLLFKSGSHELQQAGKAVLARVALDIIKQNPQVVRIEGHTDDDRIVKSKRKYMSNFHLSAMRALSVLHYLESQGVPSVKLYVVGHGQHSPTGADKSQNRRVEIKAYK